MAKEFSFKDARELINFYKKLLKNLIVAAGYPNAKLKDVKTQFNSLKRLGYFANLANHEIEGVEYTEKQDQFNRLLLFIDNYIKGTDLAATCDGLYKDNYMEINSRIDRLSPAGNPIAWVFPSKKKKDEAVEQFQHLLDYKTSPFVENSSKVLSIMLSNPDFASRNPFAYQKADRLCYCDILEHLILHIKIAEEPKNKDANENELVGIGGAASFICRQINDCYSGKNLTQYFMVRIREIIKDNFDDYIMILQRLYDLIKSNPMYSVMFSKDDICAGYGGEIVQRVYSKIV